MEELKKLVTEQRNPKTMELDEWSTLEIIQMMNEEDYKVVEAVHRELFSIEKVIKQAIACLENDGRIIYVGAGTSGRIGMLDAVECPPTFGFDPKRFMGLLAGQNGQMYAKEEAEDSEELGKEDLVRINLCDKDMVIGLAASGRTPYVIGALKYASFINASTASIACNKNASISKYAQNIIELDCGPEVLTGSTRLKAGTAQKMVCNMISTATMIGLNKVYENLMVDVDVSNEKLYERWINIVKEATHADRNLVESTYEKAHHNAKAAICMILLNTSYEETIDELEKQKGNVKQVLKHSNISF
ncbi:MAG: N-acetylmuramic acid 6-phosphate etherase [Traorella sp.]